MEHDIIQVVNLVQYIGLAVYEIFAYTLIPLINLLNGF